MRHVDDDERRARIARRHGLAPWSRLPDPEAATTAMTVLHATEPASVHLALHARVSDLTVAEVERALYADRSLVKQLAMRRTLFVFPRQLLPAAWGSASARVAAQQHAALGKEIRRQGLAADPDAWLDRACAAVLERLADGCELTSRELREQVPELTGRLVIAPDKSYGGELPIAPRVLTLLGARGDVVRGHNDGHWRLQRPRWVRAEAWLGRRPSRLPAEEGYAELVRRWLVTFGPGTETDLVWWLGATKGIVRDALVRVGAVQVSLDRDQTGWLLPEDQEPVEEVAPWAALLPVLDPTTMGWKQRDFYLDPGHTPYLFDGNGNAGSTAWWNGRIVGCWVQHPGAEVRVVLREDVGADGRAALETEAVRLTQFLDGARIAPGFTSEQMRSARLA